MIYQSCFFPFVSLNYENIEDYCDVIILIFINKSN